MSLLLWLNVVIIISIDKKLYMMELPKFNETFQPILDVLKDGQVGVQTKSVYEVKAVDNDFFDAEEI